MTQQKQAEKKLYQQLELEKILYKITINIRQSLSLKEILQATVTEIRQLLDCDRVLVYQFDPEFNGQIVAESVTVQENSILGISLEDTCFKKGCAKHYLQGRKNSINNIETADISPCYYNLLSNFNVKANLVVPIIINDPVCDHQLWGLLIAHDCTAPREWSSDELNLLDQLAVSISIAIQQSQLYQQIKYELKERCKAGDALIKLNTELERRVRERTVVLSQTNQQLLNEIQEHRRTENKLNIQNSKVKLFTDITLNIRQSLQLEQILQTTVTKIRDILHCDRVLIYRIFPPGKKQIITESVIDPELSILNQILNENVFSSSCIEFYKHKKVKAIDNIEDAYPVDQVETLCMRELMQQLQVKSKLIVPIFQNGILWGLMLAHQCYKFHHWTEFQIEIMEQISEQVGIAIAQAQLLMDLRESQEQLKDLFENANDLIQLISPEDGHLIYVNRAWKETLKYSDEEIKNLSVFDLITNPEQIYSFRQYFEQLKSGNCIEQNSIEIEYITKTGEIVILEGSANCRFENGKPTVIRAFLRDVTAKKQAEKQLKNVLQELTYHKIALDEMAIVVIADHNGIINYFNYKFSHTKKLSVKPLL
jgi:PAS domain S-box-containing protein